MLKTLKAARESTLRNVTGACSNSADFLAVLNEAVERLMSRGDWFGTVIPIRTCVYAGCVVWPRYVDTVRHINVCNTPIQVESMWTQFLEYNTPNWQDGSRWWGTNTWGNSLGESLMIPGVPGYGAMPYMMDQGKSPTFQDVQGDGRLLRFYPQYQADIGKTITVFGVDNNGQTLRTKQSDGTWQDGWVVTLAAPYAGTTDYVRRVDRVLLDDMEGNIFAYAYNVADAVLEPLATYDPHDTNPAFERYKLDLRSCNSGDCLKTVVALVKLRFIPARYDNDIIPIDNLHAVKLMIQSVKAEEANNPELADKFEAQAIRELNVELRDKSPLDQMAIGVSSFGKRSYIPQRAF